MFKMMVSESDFVHNNGGSSMVVEKVLAAGVNSPAGDEGRNGVQADILVHGSSPNSSALTFVCTRNNEGMADSVSSGGLVAIVNVLNGPFGSNGILENVVGGFKPENSGKASSSNFGIATSVCKGNSLEIKSSSLEPVHSVVYEADLGDSSILEEGEIGSEADLDDKFNEACMSEGGFKFMEDNKETSNFFHSEVLAKRGRQSILRGSRGHHLADRGEGREACSGLNQNGAPLLKIKGVAQFPGGESGIGGVGSLRTETILSKSKKAALGGTFGRSPKAVSKEAFHSFPSTFSNEKSQKRVLKVVTRILTCTSLLLPYKWAGM